MDQFDSFESFLENEQIDELFSVFNRELDLNKAKAIAYKHIRNHPITPKEKEAFDRFLKNNRKNPEWLKEYGRLKKMGLKNSGNASGQAKRNFVASSGY